LGGPLYTVIVLTAVAMGFRSATVRQLAVPDLPTTVLTMTLTGVASDSVLGGGANPRVGRRLAAIVAMLGGAAVGTLLIRVHLALPLVLGGILALATIRAYAEELPTRA